MSAMESSYNDDPLFLQPSDHPGLQLINLKLSGQNFQLWSKSVKIALKGKLGFLDGSCTRPAENSSRLNQWIRCDSMVLNWLLNSMIPELAEAFLYVDPAKELWSELTERFGDGNGPLLYQLEKEISELYQRNDSVAAYYTKLKKFWEELSDLSEIPDCKCAETCDAVKKILANEQRQKLIHFLMHLNDEYDSIRGQILLLDPQPNVTNAFLHGFIDEEVYMQPPAGYTKASPGQGCKLRRSLYGLKQASRQWNLELTSFLLGKGFRQSKSNYFLFSNDSHGRQVFILVYVDDLLITGDSVDGIAQIKQDLHTAYTIKDLGLARYFLGIEISWSPTGTFLNQRKYVLDILSDAGLTGAKPAKLPLPQV